MSTLAKRYADAIFELMEEETEKSKENLSNEFMEMGDLYKENIELKKIFNNPTLKLDLKKDILSEIVKKSSFKSLTVKSLNFILESDRFSYIPEIALEVSKLVDISLNRVTVTIVLARDLKKGLISVDPLLSVKKEIETVLEGKKIIYKTEIDPSIIGGVVVKIGDKLYDFSVKNSLESIKLAIG
jgi:F-type H+-transporting ATPase subunit delta